MSSTVHVIRHGEVENPGKILYGRQPGWRLSKRGLDMATTLGDWSKSLNLGALHVSPLQRAQETAAPIAAAHNLSITTDERLIEAANIFEGKPFGVGDGVLRHPASWRHLWNPWKPSWGEPYDEQVTRMLAAIWAICSSLWVRAFRAYGMSESTATIRISGVIGKLSGWSAACRSTSEGCLQAR